MEVSKKDLKDLTDAINALSDEVIRLTERLGEVDFGR